MIRVDEISNRRQTQIYNNLCLSCKSVQTINLKHESVTHIIGDILLSDGHLCMYPQFYSLHLTKPKVVEGEGGDRKGDRWRQKSKQLKFFSMGSEERVRSGSTAEGRESPSIGEAMPTNQQLAPYKVQVIDVITRTDGIRPYSLYVLLVRREGGE